MIKAIVFDFYGVVVPDVYWTWLEKTVKDLESRKGYFSDLVERLDKGDLSQDKYLDDLSKATNVPTDQISPQMDKALIVNLELIQLIQKLKKKVKIGILSNSEYNWLVGVLAKYNLIQYFDEVVVSSEVGFLKPEPEIFKVIMDRLGVKAYELIFIDDRLKNVEGAIELGIEGILFKGTEKLKIDLRARGFDF